MKIDDAKMVNKYFRDIKSLDMSVLTHEEENELAIKIQNGDQKALKKLIVSNLKFVVTIAHEYKNNGMSLSDLINEGNLGLIKAALKYDHTRGNRFISYAVFWIRQAIKQSLSDNSRTIRYPVNVINKINELNKLYDLDTSKNIVNDKFLNSLPKTQSVNDIITDEGSELSEFIGVDDESLMDIDNYNEDVNEIIKDKVKQCLKILNNRERSILIAYFGLFDNKSKNLEDIGVEYGLTKERVRQIKEKAIKKLKYNITTLI